MPTGVASWSKTASANASADANVNAAEGMAPAQVNDAMRGMMASTAMWRDDLAGVTTGGTSTNYTVTTNQGFASLAALNGRRITIIMHTSSGAAPVLSVDGLASKPIRLQTGAVPPAAALVQGSPYALLYNDTTSEFLVYDVASGIPTGAVMQYAGSVAPAGWHLCCGQAVSRTTYAALFAVLGAQYGLGTGGDATTFGVPDLRGRVVAGLDNVGGFGFAGRITAAGGNFDGTLLGGAGGNQSINIAQNQLPQATVNTTDEFANITAAVSNRIGSWIANFGGGLWNGGGGGGADTPIIQITDNKHHHQFSINGNVPQQLTSELPPTLVLNYIIKF
jgi:microcystin-dependent protein